MNYLIDLINNSNYDIYFLVVDKNLDIDLPELKFFYKIYLPEGEIKNSGHLLSLKNTQEYIIQNSKKNNHLPAILPFKPSAKIEKICEQNAWINLSNPAHLNRFLEDKVKFYEFCKKEKLPTIPSFIDNFNQNNFEKYANKKPIVIQTHFGWAGNSTFLANNYKEIENKIAQNTIVKFSPYIEGKTYTNNCCLTRYGLLQSPPALQLNQGFATVGRTWPSKLPEKEYVNIVNISNNFANSLKLLNYQGYFGLDFMISGKDVFLLECNPRLTASFAFYHLLETQNDINSLFYYHILELLDIQYNLDIEKEQKRVVSNIKGSEKTPRDKSNQITEKIHEI
jgi:predicted ATP-grasp superfamily ATP-dependent carboligase